LTGQRKPRCEDLLTVVSCTNLGGSETRQDFRPAVNNSAAFIFVCRGDITEVCHYQGDPLRFPDARVIRNAIAEFGERAPAGYGIDFGVMDNGRTVLVEVNEGYSLGSYGLNSVEYAELLEARWFELTASAD
jgi:hypothetical protein